MPARHDRSHPHGIVASAIATSIVAASFGACNSTVTPQPPASSFVISPAAVFAGSTVTIRGADFRALGARAATVTIGDADVALTRVDDTTMSALVPATAGGVLNPALKLNQRQVPPI